MSKANRGYKMWAIFIPGNAGFSWNSVRRLKAEAWNTICRGSQLEQDRLEKMGYRAKKVLVKEVSEMTYQAQEEE